MKCPACSKNLKEMMQSDLTVDVCAESCGGIWFDQFELQKVDEAHESLGEALLDVGPHTKVQVDHKAKRFCPKCSAQPLVRHFYSIAQEIEVDDCPSCGGIWLDAGELAAIRKMFKT